ncbi:hypothetical protein M9H77_36573 [Catharanthus roseus]|uniref:Uncharacterized protein n=1 Tax=Catharanthus roseus TaxID=4058 RepID=A0ACB9ZSK4_CATRO|nr:hypothetical protein M9H77_36573 [Catharanthus roseus]
MVGEIGELSLSSSSFSSSSSSYGPPPMAKEMFFDFDSSDTPDTYTSSSNSSNNNNNNNNNILLDFPLLLGQTSLVIVFVVMLLFFLILLLIACKFKPWRRFLSSSASASRTRTIKHGDDLERPLVSEDLNLVHNQSNDFARNVSPVEADQRMLAGLSLPWGERPAPKQRLPISAQLQHSDSFILDIPDTSEDSLFGKTLLRPHRTSQSVEVKDRDRKEDLKYSPTFDGGDNGFRESVPSHTVDQRSILVLEVIAGPSCGARYSIKSTNSSRLPLTLGRVSPSDLLLKDSEVSGKHALINWNADKLGWELVDMGSLNGTLLNSQAINHPHTGSRHWGDPVEIASGDIITLGTTSKILVQISSTTESQIPFGVGVVSDAMALRRGGKKLPMEDVCFYHWPLPGTEQFGLFAVCDGHGGPSAAISASKIMPEMFSSILSDANRREKVLSQGDASDVLREAFCQTEACMNHYYEGCTATALLVWADGNENFLAQCANLGDSACFMIIDGKQVKMTEDHRISSFSERLRMQEVGAPLKDGETRICGINLARMLGDKFLKQQDPRFSSEPYISQVVYINQASRGFALMASDGFWDVVNVRKACQLIQQTKERNIGEDGEKYAEKVASCLLNEARTQRTKDNTSIIFLDFDNVVYRINSSCKVDDH